MRHIFLLIMIFVVGKAFGDYDPTATKFPYEYYYDSADNWWYTTEGYELDGASHNIATGTTGQYFSLVIKDDGWDPSCYKFYVEMVKKVPGRRPGDGKFIVESIGSINLNRPFDPAFDTGKDATRFTKIKWLGNTQDKYLTIFFDDFSITDVNEGIKRSLRVVVIKEAGGTCGGEELIGEKFYAPGEWGYTLEDVIDFTSPSEIKFNIGDMEICQGDVVNNKTKLDTLGITGTASITFADANEAGYDAFQASYVSIVNDSVVIGAGCPVGSYKVAAELTDDKGTPADASDDVVVKDTFAFFVNPVPTATLTANNTTLCPGDTLILTAGGLDGNDPDQSYQWTGGSAAWDVNGRTTRPGANWNINANKGDLIPRADATYQVIATNEYGCSDTSAEVRITVNPKLLAALKYPDPSICPGGSATIEVINVTDLTSNPVSGVTYEWTPATDGNGTTLSGSLVTVKPTTTTDFKLVVKKDGYCSSDTLKQTVTVKPLPVVKIAGDTAVCVGSPNVVLTASITSPTGVTPTWSWNSTTPGVTWGSNTVSFTPATAGTYQYTAIATVNGCTDSTTLEVNVYDNPQITSVSGDKTDVCLNDTVHMTLTATGGTGNLTYSWTGAGTSADQNPEFKVTSTGNLTYNVTVEDEKGCKATDAVNVTGRKLDIVSIAKSPTGDVNYNSTSTLTPTMSVVPATTVHYTWSPTVASVDAAGKAVTNALTANTTFILDATDDYGCADRDSVKVTVSDYTLMQINLTGVKAYCEGEDIDLKATITGGMGTKTYAWTCTNPVPNSVVITNANTANAKIDKAQVAAGTTYDFKLEVRDAILTIDTTVSITIQAKPVVTLTADADTVCPGSTVSLTATGGSNDASYSWLAGASGNGATKTGVTVNTKTIFQVKVTNAAGCSETASDTVAVYTPEVLTVPNDTALCITANNLTLTVSGLTAGPQTQYTWSSVPADAMLAATGTTQTLQPAQTTTYTVGGTDVHGCTVTSKNIVVTVDAMPTLTLSDTALSACNSVTLMDAIDAGASTGTYEYSSMPDFSSGVSSLTAATTISTVGSHTYYVRAKNGACKTDAQKVTVNVLQNPVLRLKPNAAALLTTCAPGTVSLAAAIDSVNTTFAWGDISYWNGTGGATSTPVADPTNIAVSGTYYIKGASSGCAEKLETVTVTINVKPDVQTQNITLCAPAKGDLTAAAVTTGSTSGLTYTYYRNADYTGALTATQAASVDAGTYYLIGTTSKGCADSASVNVVINPQPQFTVAAPTAVCAPETVDLTVLPAPVNAGDAYSYSYYSDAACTTVVPNGIVSVKTNEVNSYYVVGMMADGTGCTDTVSVNVTIYPQPSFVVTDPAAVCEGDSIDITAAFTHATGVTYQYYNSDFSTSLTSAEAEAIKTAGTYQIIATDGTHACKDTSDVTVPAFKTVPTVDLVVQQEGCEGEQVTLTANATPSTGVTYTWGAGITGTASSSTATATLNAGDNRFTVKVTLDGCESEIAVDTVTGNTVTATLALSAGGATISCGGTKPTGTTIKLDASGSTNGNKYTFVQVVAGVRTVIGAESTNDTCLATLGSTATTYRVIVESEKGCLDSTDCLVQISGGALDIVAEQNGEICSNSSDFSASSAKLIARASGGETDYTYEWVVSAADAAAGLRLTSSPAGGTTGASTATITSVGTLVPGTYTIVCKVKDNTGTEDQTDVTFTIRQAPVLALNVTELDTCNGKSVDLSTTYVAAADMTYSYYTSAWATTSSAVSVADDYHIIATSTTTGCTDTAEVKVSIHPNPTVTLPDDGKIVCAGETIDLTAVTGGGTGALTYEWTGATKTAVDSIASKPIYAGNNNYSVLVKDAEGCTDIANATIVGDSVSVTLAASASVVPVNTSVTWTATPTNGTVSTYEFIKTSVTPEVSKGTQATNTWTETISEKTCYKVVAVSANNCRDTSAAVCVEIDGASLLKVIAKGDTVCAGAGVATLTSATVGSGTITSRLWKQIDGTPALPIADPTAQDIDVDITHAVVDQPYQFEVSINGGLTMDTATLLVRQSPQITKLEILDSCTVAHVQVTASDYSTLEWKAITSNVQTPITTTNASQTVANIRLTSGTDYTVAVIARNEHCQDSMAISGKVINLGLALDLAMNDTCASNLYLKPTLTNGGGYSANYRIEYEYTSFDGSVRDNRNIDFDITQAFQGIPAFDPGKYKVTKFYNRDYPQCPLTVEDSVLVDTIPVITLDNECLARHKDSSFVLNVVNPKDYNYIWDVSVNNSTPASWTASGDYGNGTTGTSVNSVMKNEDIRYSIEATTKSPLACAVRDTATVYLIPEAPVSDIDTAQDKLHIQLKWQASALADDYTVWSREWDPYCLTGNAGNVYQAEPTGTKLTALSWAETSMNSLEFYYITANREICGTTYQTVSVDTFGYAKHIVDGTQTLLGSAYQYAFPYIFDMTSKGWTNLENMGNYLMDGNDNLVNAVGIWNKDNCTDGANLWWWEWNNYAGFGGIWLGGPNGAPVPGECYAVEIFGGEILEFVIFGRLNDAASYSTNICQSTQSYLNPFYIPFDKILLTKPTQISGSNLNIVSALNGWVYVNPEVLNYDNKMMNVPGGLNFDSEMGGISDFPRRAGYDVLFFDVTSGFTWPN